ncbi:MAG: hypothetical protein AABX03_04660, partial [Nanoarchaeota archaeon]
FGREEEMRRRTENLHEYLSLWPRLEGLMIDIDSIPEIISLRGREMEEKVIGETPEPPPEVISTTESIRYIIHFDEKVPKVRFNNFLGALANNGYACRQEDRGMGDIEIIGMKPIPRDILRAILEQRDYDKKLRYTGFNLLN